MEQEVYTVKDVQRVFSCGKNVAYGIMNSDHFPSFRINKKIYVHREKLDKWIKDNTGNELHIEY
jgi:hypothetical protein